MSSLRATFSYCYNSYVHLYIKILQTGTLTQKNLFYGSVIFTLRLFSQCLTASSRCTASDNGGAKEPIPAVDYRRLSVCLSEELRALR